MSTKGRAKTEGMRTFFHGKFRMFMTIITKKLHFDTFSEYMPFCFRFPASWLFVCTKTDDTGETSVGFTDSCTFGNCPLFTFAFDVFLSHGKPTFLFPFSNPQKSPKNDFTVLFLGKYCVTVNSNFNSDDPDFNKFSGFNQIQPKREPLKIVILSGTRD